MSTFLSIFRGFLFTQEHLFSRNSTRKPLNLKRSPIFANTPCKSTCLYNAPSFHTVDEKNTHTHTHPVLLFLQARRKSTKITFWVRRLPVGVGVFHAKGGGRKVCALPRKFVFPGFQREESGMSREICRMSRTPGGVQNVCAKKVRAHFSFLLFLGVFVSLVFFLLGISLVFLSVFSSYVTRFLKVRQVRKILDP